MVGAPGFEPGPPAPKAVEKNLSCWSVWLCSASWCTVLDLAWQYLDPSWWGEPLTWHNFFGHSFRFCNSVLASSSKISSELGMMQRQLCDSQAQRVAVGSL